MTSSHPHKKLDQLLQDLLDGEWNPEKKEQLDTLLRSDAAARVYYRELMATHAMLDAEFRGASGLNEGAVSTESPAGAAPLLRVTEMQATRQRRQQEENGGSVWFGRFRLAAAALLIVSVGIGAFSLLNSQRTVQQPVARGVAGMDSRPNKEDAHDDGVFAVVTRTLEPRWTRAEEAVRPGQELAKRWVKLLAGVVQFEFRNGACVTLQGPAEFRLVSPSECFVQSGRLTVLAPPGAANFTVHSPFSKVIDLGTEFGMVVNDSGELDVHVLDGQVEVTLEGDADGAVVREKLSEQQAATIRAGRRQLEDIPFDEGGFESIRAATLWRTQPLRLQFDCGSRAGGYHGTESPAHAADDMLQHETHWNVVVGDQTGGFVLSDGRVLTHRIELDVGHGKESVDWDAVVDTETGPQGDTRGVFDTALGRDVINPPSGISSDLMGLRVRGLPAGTYRVYVLGRASLDHANWGNYLVEKAHMASVGTDLSDMDASPLRMASLNDPNAAGWVPGQTHVVADVTVSGPDQYLTIITAKDKENSRTGPGGRAVILGVQILQVAGGLPNSDV